MARTAISDRGEGTFSSNFVHCIILYPYPQACKSFLSDTATINSLLSKSYDLAILDGAFPECALGLVHRLGVPFMYINTVGFYTGSLSLAGNPNVYAVTPHVFTKFTQSMDFLQRFVNVVTHISAELLHKVRRDLFFQKILTAPQKRVLLHSLNSCRFAD